MLYLSSCQRPEEEIPEKGNSKENDRKELTLYEILGTSKSATRSELKSQYIVLAKKFHPDAQPSKGKKVSDDETFDFQQIAEAWRTLGNPKSRRRYDRELKAKEWGEKAERFTNESLEQAFPVALKVMDSVAVPFLRRTTATTLAVGQAIATGLSSSSPSLSTENKDCIKQNDKTNKDDNNPNNFIDNIRGFEIEENEAVEYEVNNVSKQRKTAETLTDTLISAIVAGKQAGRTVDASELTEKSNYLQQKAKNEEEKAKHIIEELESVKEKRLFATLQFTDFALSSDEAEEVLEKLERDNNLSFANRSMKKNAIEREIQSLRKTETQFSEKLESYTEIDLEWNEWLKKQEEAKENLSLKKNKETEARKALDIAQKMVIEAKDDLVKVSSALDGVEQAVRKRAQEMDRVTMTLSRKQERVRNALRRKTELLKGGINVQYIAEQEVLKLRRKEIQLLGESRQIMLMVAQLQSRADKLKKRAETLEQWKN